MNLQVMRRTLAQTAPPTVSNEPTGNQEAFVTDNNSANQGIVPDSQHRDIDAIKNLLHGEVTDVTNRFNEM